MRCPRAQDRAAGGSAGEGDGVGGQEAQGLGQEDREAASRVEQAAEDQLRVIPQGAAPEETCRLFSVFWEHPSSLVAWSIPASTPLVSCFFGSWKKTFFFADRPTLLGIFAVRNPPLEKILGAPMHGTIHADAPHGNRE